MIRQIIKPSSTDVHISVPDKYVGKTLEIIAFSLDEPTVEPTEMSFSMIDEFYDNVRVDLTDYKFDRDEANSR